MPFALALPLAIVALVVIHISAMALAGRLFGIAIKDVAFGFGPVLLKMGTISLRAVPFAGYVKFKDTSEEGIPQDAPADYAADAFNHQPRLVQAVVPLLGAGSLILVAVLARPASGIRSVLSGFSQMVAGAFGPLTTAQSYIAGTAVVAQSQGLLALLGILAAKMAVANLLPFPNTNGGQAILLLLRADAHKVPRWQETVTQWGIFPWFAFGLSWLAAIGYFYIA